MNKILSLLTSLFLVFGLVGCGSDPKPDIEKTIINYYTAIQEGDVEKANTYCTDDYSDALGITEINSIMDEHLLSLNFGEDFNEDAMNFMKNLLSQIVKKYKIEHINVQGDNATVKIVLSSIDLDSLNFNEISSELNILVETYVTEHETEITEKLQNAATEQEFYDWLYSELSYLLFGYMNEYVNNFTSKDYNMEFKLTKENENWKISESSII